MVIVSGTFKKYTSAITSNYCIFCILALHIQKLIKLFVFSHSLPRLVQKLSFVTSEICVITIFIISNGQKNLLYKTSSYAYNFIHDNQW
jgi:hypothetical protein